MRLIFASFMLGLAITLFFCILHIRRANKPKGGVVKFPFKDWKDWQKGMFK